MTGLETRGVRPDPKLRDEVAKFIWKLYEQHMRDMRVYITHELFWGVSYVLSSGFLERNGGRDEN